MSSVSDESYLDDLDRSLLNLSSSWGDVFSRTYGIFFYRLVAPIDPNKFDNASSKVKEIGIRAMIVLGAIASVLFTGAFLIGAGVVLWMGSKIFRAAAFHFQKEGFTHIRGEKKEEDDVEGGSATVMVWSVDGDNEQHFKNGVVHWSSRVDRIVDQIRDANPGVIVLQKVKDPALVETLVEKLGDRYAHFYAHMGESTWGHGSGLMVITKYAVDTFSHTDFEDQEPDLKLGFAMMEIKASPQGAPCLRIIGTELTDGVKGVAQIIDRLAKETLPLPTLFVGSGRNTDEQWALLSKHLYHSNREKTHSEKLMSEWAPIYEGEKETRQFISFVKRNRPEGKPLPVLERGLKLVNSYLVEGFDPEAPSSKTAIANNHAVVTTFEGLKVF